MADIKNDVTVNPNGAEGNPNPNPDQKNDQADVKQPGKIKQFFSKHKGKIRTGLAIAGGVAVGVAADKFGLHLGKKKDDQPGGDAAE